MHERELSGGRVGAGSLGDEPVMHAERVRSVRSLEAAAVEGPFVRSSAVCAVQQLQLVGMHDGAGCKGVWGGRSYPSEPVAL